MQKNTAIIYFVLTFFFLVFIPSCKKEIKNVPKVVESEIKYSRTSRAKSWDKLFFYRKNWFGGDGIFAIPLNGVESKQAGKSSRTMFLFSDSLIGDMEDDSLTGNDYKMVNNTIAFLRGNQPSLDSIEFFWAKNEDGSPTSIFKPTTPESEKDDYYWLGDGFVNVAIDSTIYIFAHRIRDIETTDIFKFKQVGISLLAIPNGNAPPFEAHKQMETPFFLKDKNGRNIAFGSGILVNTESAGAPNPDGYIYIYGTSDFSLDLYVIRAKPEDFEHFEKWQYWNGLEWNFDKNNLTSISTGTAKEISVSPLPDGRYILAHQNYGFIPEIFIKVGKTPYGPFNPQVNVWECLEHNEDFDYFAYNAKAHPHLSQEGELLISYNINSFDFFNDILKDPTLYRPRFITVKL